MESGWQCFGNLAWEERRASHSLVIHTVTEFPGLQYGASHPPSVVIPGISRCGSSLVSLCRECGSDVCKDEKREWAVPGAWRLMGRNGARPNWAFYRFSVSPPDLSHTLAFRDPYLVPPILELSYVFTASVGFP